MSQLALKPMSGLKSVAFFRDNTGRCCDRCGTFIKNVALVNFKDGSYQSYGSECINKILDGDNSLVRLWKHNSKMLKRWQEYLEILSLPYDQMPVDKRGYYGRGWFMVADREGKAFTCGYLYKAKSGQEINSQGNHTYCFHPTHIEEPGLSSFTGAQTFDMRGAAGGTAWEPFTQENWSKKCVANIEAKKAWLTIEIDRVGKFLARILEKGLVTKAQTEQV